eukprot:490194_1
MEPTETMQFVTGDNESDIDNESDPDCDGTGAVKEIKPPRGCSASKVTLIAVSIIILFVITAVGLTLLFRSKSRETTNEDALVMDYVLPNDTVSISTSNSAVISGHFKTDLHVYAFDSVSMNTTHYIQFINVNHNDWYGFTIKHSNGSRLTIEFMNAVNGTHSCSVGKNESLTPHDIMLFDTFWGSQIGKHYVELSMKLGVLGYDGAISHAIEQLHRFAIWIWSFIDSEQLHPWFDLEEEQEKLDVIHTASDRAGHRIKTMDELMHYTSDLESPTVNHGRSLLQDQGNCGEPFYECGNSCFGMCGLSCRCIRRICGNCGCWWGCYHHDYYCSCVGMTHSCCINVFWLKCDGSGICN